MRAAKNNFERIPVETVKKIAIELPAGKEEEGVSASGGMQDVFSSPSPRWRDVAHKVQQEQDPARMIELVQELIAAFDAEELRKHPHACRK